jgi:Tfp pilus assembly protein PilZ
MHSGVKERGYPRATLRVPVYFGVDEYTSTGKSLTVSIGGIFIETGVLMPLDQEIKLKFTIPGYGPIETKGTVVWRATKPVSKRFRNPGIAVKFTELNLEQCRMIEDYVIKKSRIIRTLKHLLSEKKPNMKQINELLTSTYIRDYSTLDDLRKKLENELALFRLRARV